MKAMVQTIIAVLATTSLSACGSGGSSAGNARGDVAANDIGAAAVANNPFADAEKRMNQAMMAAAGSDAGQTWALQMIAHHQGAIDMSKIVLGQNPTAEVAKMARDDIQKQTTDIASIRKLVKSAAPNQKSAEIYRRAMMDMEQAMMSARGTTVSETYLRKMLAHHKGAVAMSDVALQNGVSGAMRAQIEKTKTENQRDAAMVQAMLDGKPMAEAKSGSASEHMKDMKDMNMSGNMSGMDMNGMNHM